MHVLKINQMLRNERNLKVASIQQNWREEVFSLISLTVAMYMYRLMHVFLSHGGEKETLVLLIAQKQSYQV